MPPPGQQITVRRSAGVDQYGDPLPKTDHPVDGCVWWPRMSQERTDMRDTLIVGYELSMPYGADVRYTDEVLLPGVLDAESGEQLVWQIDGEKGEWASPYTGRKAGSVVALKRWSG